MKTISELLKINFDIKIKSFFISDGKSKILLARQFTEMSHMQLIALNSVFIRQISLLTNQLTVFVDKTNQFLSYQLNITNNNDNTSTNHQDIFYFVLVTSAEFSIIEAELLLKSITRFILDIINYKYAISQTSFIELIKSNAFNILLGLDDMINPILGNEALTMNKIASNIKMESMEEKVFAIEKNKKIDLAHNELVKGMEEIDKLKYENRYKKNGISNEDIEKAERDADLRESQMIIDEIARERIRDQINKGQTIIEGLNLQSYFLNRMSGMSYEDRESDYFINSCENVIHQMMIKEMKRMNAQGDTEYDYNYSGLNLFSGPKLVMTPIQFYYANEEDEDN